MPPFCCIIMIELRAQKVEVFHVKRGKTIRRIDRRVFRLSADRTRKINVKPPIVRGGFRF